MTDPQNTPAEALARVQKVYHPPAVNATAEEVVEHLLAFRVAKETFKEISGVFMGAVFEWLKANDQELQVELEPGRFLRWYAGNPRKVRCTDPQGALEALLTAANGDLEKVVSTFASDPFKQGETKTVLGEEEWSKYFRVEHPPTVKDTETKRQKKGVGLQFVDTKYLPR